MVWYNSFGLFKSVSKIEAEVTLFCDNPQCGSVVIQDGFVVYDENYGEIYHSRECALLANVHRSIRSLSLSVGNYEVISLSEALKLFREGKLSQSRLEERVE